MKSAEGKSDEPLITSRAMEKTITAVEQESMPPLERDKLLSK